MTDPKDPMTPLGQAAASMHEMYVEYMRAGFTKKEAFELVKETVRGMSSGWSQQGES